MFADEWQKMLEDPHHGDVTFIVNGNHRLLAHKIVLASASTFLQRVLHIKEDNAVNAKGHYMYAFRGYYENLQAYIFLFNVLILIIAEKHLCMVHIWST